MEEVGQQNINPNTKTPELADLIRENIYFQHDQSIKRALLKESMIKASLDKDFEQLFNHHESQKYVPVAKEIICSTTSTFLEVTEEIKDVCNWLEDTEQFAAMAYMPYNSVSRLIHILHQKIEGTAIIITEYPTFWIHKMENMGRLSKLKWGLLSTTQSSDDKIKVLELYELKKLKLLFITPSLLKYEQYHEFDCDLLLITDLHLYENQTQFLSKVITKTKPYRVVALYHTLMHENYKEHEQNNFKVINLPNTSKFTFIVLKCQQEQKFRNLMAYLSKNEYKRILIVVNKKQEAACLHKKLLLESKTSLNLFQHLSQCQMQSTNSSIEFARRLDREKEQERVYQIMKKVSSYDITICYEADFLRFGNYDLMVNYTFTDVVRFVQSSPTTLVKLMLFSEEDYHNLRNFITSELITKDNLQNVVMKMIQKPLKREENNKKRYYSDVIDEKLFDCYSISKQYAEKDEEKVIRINSFCKKYQISAKLFNKIIETLQKNTIIGINYRTIYEIEIDIEHLTRFRKQFPFIEETRRKINLLNVSTKLQKTTRSILEELKAAGIRHKITEEALQIKILKNYEEIQWTTVSNHVNQLIIKQSNSLDKSFETYRDCAYGSIELTKRQKALQKKNLLLSFLSSQHKTQEKDSNLIGDSFHRSNLLTSEIEEWLRHSEEIEIDQHDLVLLLQGVEKGRISRFKDDPIYGRYRRLKYIELIEAVSRIYKNKKVKPNQ